MTQQTVFITGAASGIGLASARLFYQQGWKVALCDIDEAALSEAAASMGEDVWFGVLDVTDFAAAERAVAEVSAQLGGIDVLLNCAGILRTGPFESIEPAQHAAIYAINVTGLNNLCLAAYPRLLESDNPVVINMSSASALYGVPTFASYSASKFAVRGLTEALNIEWGRQGIRVCDVMPPFVNTHMLQSQVSPPPIVARMGVDLVAEDVAKTIWRAARGRCKRVHYPVSWKFRVTVWLSQFFPTSVSRSIMRFLSRE